MRYFPAYFLFFLAVACSGGLDRPGQEVSCVEEYVEMQTKGVGNNDTYIFYLIGNANTATQGVSTFGTYVDAYAGQPLMPGGMDAQGNPEYDSSKGLRAGNGSYRLFIASPATEVSETSAGSGLYGYHYTRNAEGVYVSDPVAVTLGGVYLADSDGADYVYDASSQVLRQPRSRLKLNFACGSDIEQTTLQSINLKNFIAEGFYIPVETRFYYEDTDIQQSVTLYPVEGQGDLMVKKGESVNLDIDEYILSMNYGETDASGNTKYPMPALEIEVGESDEDVVVFNANLGWNFRPQHTYEFTIIINSVYVNLVVTASPWDENGEVGADIDEPQTWQITFPLIDGTVNLLDWEKVDKQTGTIG